MGEARRCSTCRINKPEDQFNRNSAKPSGWNSQCKGCKKKWESTDSGKALRSKIRKSNRLKKYGLAPEEYAKMLKRQKGRCAICKQLPEGVLAVDHSHFSGVVRGLLCRTCNTGLGHFKDSVLLLLNAAAYLSM